MARRKLPVLTMEIAGPAHDEELRRLLRETAMPGTISVSMEREPDFFLGASIEGDCHDTVVARLEGEQARLVGLGTRSVHHAFINGEARRLGYLGQVRVDPGFRRGMTVLKRGFGKLKEIHDADDVPFYTTTIVEDNVAARQVLTRGWKGLPTYRERERFVTLVIPVWRRRPEIHSSRFAMREATEADLPRIAACLLVGGVRGGSRLVVGPESGETMPPVPVTLALKGVHEAAGVGTIFPDDKGNPSLHLHAACGRGGETKTGCVRPGVDIWKVGEVVLIELTGSSAVRKRDPETGFNLLEP